MMKNILPKGKYNGKTIDGLEFRFKFHLLTFYFFPHWIRQINTLVWLWFTITIEPHYDT